MAPESPFMRDPEGRIRLIAPGSDRISSAARTLHLRCGDETIELLLCDGTLDGTPARRTSHMVPPGAWRQVWGDLPTEAPWLGAGASGTRRGRGPGWSFDRDTRVIVIAEVWRGARFSAFRAVHQAALAVFVARLMERGGLMLHAATFEADRMIFPVLGASGAGKSTLGARLVAHLWSEEHALVEPAVPHWSHVPFLERRATAGRTDQLLPVGGLRVLLPDRGRTALVPIAARDAVRAVWPCVRAPVGTEALAIDALARLVAAHPPVGLSHSLADPVDLVWTTLASRSAV